MNKSEFLKFYERRMKELEFKLNKAFRDADIVKMNNYNGKIDMLNEVLDLFERSEY